MAARSELARQLTVQRRDRGTGILPDTATTGTDHEVQPGVMIDAMTDAMTDVMTDVNDRAPHVEAVAHHADAHRDDTVTQVLATTIVVDSEQ